MSSTPVAESPSWDNDKLLREWLRRTRESQWGHYEAERSLLRGHYLIGIPLVALTAFAGTAVFATLSSNPQLWFKVVVALTSVIAAILSGLQTFLRNADRASAHRTAASGYGALRRELEQSLAGDPSRLAPEQIDGFRTRLDDLAGYSPALSQRVWDRTERKLAKR
jgi:hypothetical protein